VYRCLQHFNRRLLNCQVCHFNIKSMIVNSLDALTYVVCKARFANFLQAFIIRNGTSLVEFPEKIVEIDY